MFDWVDHYQFFMFDFDGLLVDTEYIQYQAYRNALRNYGFDLPWSFETYCSYAHYEASAVKDALYKLFPKMAEEIASWDILYQAKREEYSLLIQEGKIDLMPGVKHLLEEIQRKDIPHCVVTHSPKDQVFTIRDFFPVLQKIPIWVTRENYSLPKPNPQPYLYAIETYAPNIKHIIGFEDSPRGVYALSGTKATTVMISSYHTPPIQEQEEGKKIFHFPNFNDLMHLKKLS